MERELLDELIASYDVLSITDKRRELGREIAELSIVIKELLSSQTGLQLNENILKNYENLYSKDLSESEYFTGLYEDVICLKEDLGLFLAKNIFDEYEQ